MVEPVLKHIGPRFNPYYKRKKKKYSHKGLYNPLSERAKGVFFLAVLNMILVKEWQVKLTSGPGTTS